ncbi:hypothetical protein WJX75_004077 [Coccomyxa subellipsoidea]|uniref:Acyltransferase 3 domain-containing protein n=1 Tax=Coccomyxa subellipsoidea TaxID=248742 RepID=A0ABR2YKR8_9CHLO
MQKLSRHSTGLHALWACLALSNFAGCFVNKVGPQLDPTHLMANPMNCAFAYILIAGVLSPLLPALTLLLVTSKGVGTPSAVTNLFSLPVFKWFADITYDIFIIHPLVMFGMWFVLPPSLWYYRKRLLRIAPAYYLMLVVVRILVAVLGESKSVPQHVRLAFFGPLGVFHTDVCKNTMMHNILFAHNQLPAAGCYMMTWSLAVQMQFWFTFPLALLLLQPDKPGFRDRVFWSLVATIGAVLAYRAWQVHETQLWLKMPLPLFAPPDPETLGMLIFLGHHEYFGTLSRLGPLCFGALAALLVMDSSCTRKLSRQSRRLHALWVCLILSNFSGCFINKIGPERDSTHMLSNPVILYFAYVFITGVLSPLLPALTLVLTTAKPPVGLSATLARLFSSPVFKWLAEITYDVFLVHPLVMFCLCLSWSSDLKESYRPLHRKVPIYLLQHSR